ncbi:MAG: hypothetical protein KGS48_01625 [Bacteroidetes bacterium]|nr:hypothetical protein [Bacteroidota bacterium]
MNKRFQKWIFYTCLLAFAFGSRNKASASSEVALAQTCTVNCAVDTRNWPASQLELPVDKTTFPFSCLCFSFFENDEGPDYERISCKRGKQCFFELELWMEQLLSLGCFNKRVYLRLGAWSIFEVRSALALFLLLRVLRL